MKTHLAIALSIATAAIGCHRGSSSMQREQKNYDVVQEGQASGVTSTISAPGETPPPMTNTSADTTSNFTIAPNVDTSGTAPAMPPPMTSAVPPLQQPRRIPVPPQPQPHHELQPPTATDTMETTSTLPPVDTTTATTSTNPPPPKKNKDKQQDQQQPPPDQQQQPPDQQQAPPPPTQTDTRGW